MKQLSREHQAILQQKLAFSSFRPVVEDEQSIDLSRFYDAFDGATSAFITAELNFRQADRCKALAVFPDYQAHSSKAGAQHNAHGLTHLDTARIHLSAFRKALEPDTPVDKGFSRRLDKAKVQMKEAVAQLEIKGSDAKELGTVIDEVGDVFTIGATSVQLFEYLDKQLEELIRLRKSPGRGADSNIAVWKLVAAAVMLGLASWVVYKCYYSPWRCSKNEKAIYNSILVLAAIVFGACE